jgi:hypothetical protein
MISPKRQTEQYIARWSATLGQTMAYQAMPEGARFLGIPRWLWRKRLVAEIRFAWARRTALPMTSVPLLKACCVVRGEFQYYRART